MHLVDHQQVAMSAEGGEVQVRGRGDALVGRHVAGQAPAGVARGIVGSPDRQVVPQGLPPGRVGEDLLGLQPQAVARHHPADPLADAGGDQRLRRQYRQQRLATTWGDRGEDVTHLARLAGGDGTDDAQ